MQLIIPRSVYSASKLTGKDHQILSDAFNSGRNAIYIEHWSLSKAGLEELYMTCHKSSSKALLAQLETLRSLEHDDHTKKINDLQAFETALQLRLLNKTIDGWLYEISDDNGPLPYLVQSVKHLDGRRHDDRPVVTIRLVANTNGKTLEKTVSYNSDDVSGRPVQEILANSGFFFESSDLKKQYKKTLRNYKKYQQMHGQQFTCAGKGHIHEGHKKRHIQLSNDNRTSKCINDEELLRNERLRYTADSSFWVDKGSKKGFSTIPHHPYIYMYHLVLHMNIWVHADSIAPYKYNSGIDDYLILPEEHKELIDVLTNDIDILTSDIIDGKSGGVAVLCRGVSGVGKTLTAEVYSEVTKRPLFRVHSGQLGIDPKNLEANLMEILERSQRWGAVLLIDETDIYIRERSDDLKQNAIVAVFLRVMEYYEGLVFLTTNKGHVVDDAIISRCIAIIDYDIPSEEDTKQLWSTLATLMGVTLPPPLIEQLYGSFGRLVGRDIKSLIRLADKFHKTRGTPMDADLFIKCAKFRGIATV